MNLPEVISDGYLALGDRRNIISKVGDEKPREIVLRNKKSSCLDINCRKENDTNKIRIELHIKTNLRKIINASKLMCFIL